MIKYCDKSELLSPLIKTQTSTQTPSQTHIHVLSMFTRSIVLISQCSISRDNTPTRQFVDDNSDNIFHDNDTPYPYVEGWAGRVTGV